MLPQSHASKTCGSHIAATAAVLFWALLAGFLVFNKPFASLGVSPGGALPPLFIGEAVVLCVVAAAVMNWRDAIEFLRGSTTLKIIAMLWAYAMVRAGIDFSQRGWDAPRDSVVIGYAVLALIVPVVWRAAGTFWMRSRSDLDFADLPGVLAAPMKIIALGAAAFAIGIARGWVPLDPCFRSVKVDLLTLSAAVCAWVWGVAAVKALVESKVTAIVAALICGGALIGVFDLPARSVWIGVPLLIPVLLACAAWTPGRKIALGVAAAAVLALLAVIATVQFRRFGDIYNEYALGENLAFSIDAVERAEKSTLRQSPAFTFQAPTASHHAERIQALFLPNTAAQTDEGRVASAAVRWRAVFWMRSARYTAHHALWTGIGFGCNQTYTLHGTPAWPLFTDSLSVGNRNPHCAHLTIFVRLGLLGLALWLAILAGVVASTLRTAWSYAQTARESPDATLWRARYWNLVMIFGVWMLYLVAMSFGVVLEGPMGGVWFWTLTGVLLAASRRGTGILPVAMRDA